MSVKDIGVDPVLSDYFGALKLGVLGADAIAPRKPGVPKVGRYRYVEPGTPLRSVPDVVADKTESDELEMGFTETSYLTIKHAKHSKVSDEERDAAPSATQLEQTYVDPIAMVLALNREREVAALANSGTSGIGTADRYARWDAASGTKIQQDIATGIAAVMVGTFGMFPPNKMLIPWSVALAMGGAAELEKIMTHIFTDIVKTGLMPPTWRGMDVLVPTAMTNTAKKGQTNALQEVWGDEVRIGYCAANPFGFATTFTHAYRVNRWRIDSIKCDAVEPEDNRVTKVTNAAAMYVITKCLTT